MCCLHHIHLSAFLLNMHPFVQLLKIISNNQKQTEANVYVALFQSEHSEPLEKSLFVCPFCVVPYVCLIQVSA